LLLMELRALQAADRAALRALLQSNKLPIEDLETSPVDFLLAVEGDQLVGAIGVEAHGSTGLLRSLVVRDAARGTGVGGELVAALEARAAALGLDHLVLLTQTAAPFFAARGYVVTDRSGVAPAVQASAEFRSLCPASATCMAKTLVAR